MELVRAVQERSNFINTQGLKAKSDCHRVL